MARNKYFYVDWVSGPTSHDRVICRSLTRARDVAQRTSSENPGVRFLVNTTSGDVQETWIDGALSHHYTRGAHRLVIDSPLVFAKYH